MTRFLNATENSDGRPDVRLNRKIGACRAHLTQVEVKDRDISSKHPFCFQHNKVTPSTVTMARILFALALCVAAVSAFVAPANRARESPVFVASAF